MPSIYVIHTFLIQHKSSISFNYLCSVIIDICLLFFKNCSACLSEKRVPVFQILQKKLIIDEPDALSDELLVKAY